MESANTKVELLQYDVHSTDNPDLLQILVKIMQKFWVFPIIAPHEIIAPPHYGIITMIGGGGVL